MTNEIKNVIFDLGGVIINLDTDRTVNAIRNLTDFPFEELYKKADSTELFLLLDTGKITEEEFFRELKAKTNYGGADHLLLEAWNAMLLDVPEERLDVLVEMKHKYNTFLLSNTCEPHITAFEKELQKRHGVKNFNDYFDKVYYSCRLGMRKPNREIFEFVLKENNLKPEETVFIDDSSQHIKGAGECGINAYLLEKNREVGDLLKELKLL
jgi:putative hydrolase of the HAD superfamily